MPYVSGSITEISQSLQESEKAYSKDTEFKHRAWFVQTEREGLRYLFLLATTFINATGRPHIEELESLLDADDPPTMSGLTRQMWKP